MKNVIVIHETVAKSWARDASTLALFVALIGIGVFLESTAMQWIGAIVGFVAIVGRASKTHNDARMTIAEAREFLDKLEADR